MEWRLILLTEKISKEEWEEYQNWKKSKSNLPKEEKKDLETLEIDEEDLAKEEEEMDTYVCPKCNYESETKFEKCPKCSSNVTWD